MVLNLVLSLNSSDGVTLKLLIVLTCLAINSVHAAPPPLTYEQCKTAAGLDDAKLKDCDAKEMKRAEDDLNKLVQETLDAVDSNPRRELLRKAQRNWLAFREAECEFRGSAVGNRPIAPLLKSKCMIDQTSLRVDQLKSAVKTETF